MICLVLAVPAAVGVRVAGSPGERLVEPVAGEFHFAGRGFGHGRGMSQWGAQGAATHGIDHRTILAAYYPGTRLERADALPPVRVLLSAVGGDGLRLAAVPGMRIVSGGTTKPLPRRLDGLEVTDWRISSTDEGLRLAALTDRWQRYLAPDTDGGPVEVRNASGGVLQIVSPRDRHEYRGALRVYPDGRPGRVRVVNLVDMQSYLRSVVPAESPAGWAPEALEAQAVAARTFAGWHAAHASGDAVSDVCDTTACQVYRGYRSLRPNGRLDQQFEFAHSDQAVAATDGEELLYQGQPAFTQFSDSNGGWESAGDAPYLPSRQDPWDGLAANPSHLWSYTLPAARITRNWPGIGRPTGLAADRRDGQGPWGGRVLAVRVVGERGEVVVNGPRFAREMGMRNSWWQLQTDAVPAAPDRPTDVSPSPPSPTAAPSTISPSTGTPATAQPEPAEPQLPAEPRPAATDRPTPAAPQPTAPPAVPSTVPEPQPPTTAAGPPSSGPQSAATGAPAQDVEQPAGRPGPAAAADTSPDQPQRAATTQRSKPADDQPDRDEDPPGDRPSSDQPEPDAGVVRPAGAGD
ncbi:MAG TPA: SpoIID/LytB domain-containing protein [Sporichthyaceae bacterium]|nr:SpoIID/LytB domain-containing protein [Sporichthyaceae bacterium]